DRSSDLDLLIFTWLLFIRASLLVLFSSGLNTKLECNHTFWPSPFILPRYQVLFPTFSVKFTWSWSPAYSDKSEWIKSFDPPQALERAFPSPFKYKVFDFLSTPS